MQADLSRRQGRDIELAWADTDREQTSSSSTPYPSPSPALSGTTSDRVFVDVQYEDQDNGISESKPLKFQSGDADQSFMVNLVDPKRTVVTYSVVSF